MDRQDPRWTATRFNVYRDNGNTRSFLTYTLTEAQAVRAVRARSIEQPGRKFFYLPVPPD